MSKHALIGGGTGFIGNRLCKHLSDNGYAITTVSRMPGLRRITWLDLEKNGIPKGVNAVVNVAGQNVLDPSRRWTDGFKQNVYNSRINTSIAMAKAISSAPEVKAFVNISGVHQYPSDGKTHNEDSEVKSYDFMSKLAIDWEKAATLPQEAASRCRTVKLRCGVVVGREGGMIKSMWLPFQLGLGGPFGDGKQILPWIHIDDVCRLIQHAIENEKCNGPINAVAPEIITNGEFCKTFATVLRRPCLFAVPEFVVNTIFSKDRAVLLMSGPRLEPKRALETGFKFQYPTSRAACEEVVRKS